MARGADRRTCNMADNIPVPSLGRTVATHQIGGVDFPKNLLTKSDGTLVEPASSDKQDAILAALATLIGNVDGTEGLLGSVASEASLLLLLAKLPSLGPKASSGSVSIAPASDASFTITPASNTSRIASAAASLNPTVAKASPGTVRQVSGFCARSTPVFLRLYDTAGTPVPGTTAIRKVIYLPPLSPFVLDMNDRFATGIAYALTTGSADNDTGVLNAGDILSLNVDYF
jgi:hypothetical protein